MINSTRSAPRFVLLTGGGKYAQLLSFYLTKKSLNFEIISVRPNPPKRRRGESFARHCLAVMYAYLSSNRHLRAIAGRETPVFAKKDIGTFFLNSRKLVRTLRQLNPDYILLMSTGIVSGEVISTARVGVLNAHPGLLPWVRGVDAVASSLLEGVATGATVHFVNTGIDTGPILRRFLLPAELGNTLEKLKDEANKLALLAMVEVVEEIEAKNDLQGVVQSNRFELHRRLNAGNLSIARSIAEGGQPEELYKKWKREFQELSDGAHLFHKYTWLTETALEAERIQSAHWKRSSRFTAVLSGEHR